MTDPDSNEKGAIDRDTVINSAIQAIPYIGAPLATLYFGHKQERRFKRIESFYNEIRDEINSIQGEIADLSEHDPNEFRAILEDLHEQIESEQIEEKRKYYKTYFKSTLINPVRGNFEERKLFLSNLKELTNLQIELLAFLVKHGKPVVASKINKPGVDQALVLNFIN